MKKYILGAILSLGILISPAFTQAAGLTNVQIQAILGLLTSFGADSATIASVNTALNGGTPATGGQSFCHNFNTDLTVGGNDETVGSGSDFSALDEILNLPVPKGAGFFNEDTAAAVVQFQAKYGIRQTGYVGPMTRAKLNVLYGCRNNQQPTQPTTPVSSTPVCTKDAMVCPDGTTVGRTGPNCSFAQCPTTQPPQTTIPVTLKLTTPSSSGNSAFINASIGGSYQNKNVSYWKLTISCQAGVTMPGKYDQEMCGTELIKKTVDMADPTSDYLLLTGGVVNNSAISANVVLSLVAYDANGNYMGGDKEGIVLSPLSGLTSTQIQSTISLLISFGASSAVIANMTTALNGGTVSTTAMTPSNLMSAQVQSILSLLAQFGANTSLIANANAILSTGLTSTQIQSVLSLLSSFGANSTTIANMSTVLSGGTVSTAGLTSSGLTSSQVQAILSLLSQFGANSTMIANANAVLSH